MFPVHDPADARRDVPDPPPWAAALAGPAGGSAFALVRTVAEGVGAAGPEAFEARVRALYLALAERLAALGALRPVRLWNWVPDIGARTGEGRDRYMTFNAGRFAALRQAYGADPRDGASFPTATAVGHRGPDLVVDCLASSRPARNVENPRQRPAFRYSSRYGPLPPCFARATRLAAGPDGRSAVLLVGGTASVRGEDSVHAGSLERQIDETFENLAAIAAEAGCEPSTARALARYRDLRVYHPRPQDAAPIAAAVRRRFPAPCRSELVRAELCRPELLVEIEGLAELPAGAG